MAARPSGARAVFEGSPDDDRARKIWTLREGEEIYWEQTYPKEKSTFRRYIIGLKLDDEDHLENGTSEEAIRSFTSATSEMRNRYIIKASSMGNPYWYYLNRNIPRIEDLLSHEADDRNRELFFLAYALYRREPRRTSRVKQEVFWQHDILGNAEFTILWDRENAISNSQRIENIVKWGEDRLEEWLRSDQPMVSSYDRSHTYIPEVKYGPTVGDEDHIAEKWRELGWPHRWVFERTLHSTPHQLNPPSTRTVHLFALVDDEGNLVDRTVVKITGGDLRSVSSETRREFETLKKVSRTQPEYFLQCYGWSLRLRNAALGGPTYLGYGYLDYAPFGDLQDLLEAVYSQPDGAYMPEFYIWLVFDNLVRALQTLQWNHRVEPEWVPSEDEWAEKPDEEYRKWQRSPNWRSVVNVDIKLQNVVLADPIPPNHYPNPVMMDLGMVYDSGPDGPVDGVHEFRNNPAHMGQGLLGTEGWRPPEQIFVSEKGLQAEDLEKELKDVNVGVHTEIFNIGLIILSLMAKQQVTYEYEYRHENGLAVQPCLPEDYEGMYSSMLEDLVDACVALDPEHRPTLARLIIEVRNGFNRIKKAFPGADPTGVDLHNLQPSMQLPLKGVKRPGDFMGPAYVMRRRTAEEDDSGDDNHPDEDGPPNGDELDNPIDEDDLDSLFNERPDGDEPDDPSDGDESDDPSDGDGAGDEGLQHGNEPRNQDPAPPNDPQFYAKIRKRSTLHAHLIQRGINEPHHNPPWQVPSGENDRLQYMRDILQNDDPSGQKGMQEILDIRAAGRDYPVWGDEK